MKIKTLFRLAKNEVDKIREICEDTAKKDETFKFKIIIFKEGNSILYIYSDNEKTANRRGGWFKDRWKEHFNKEVRYDIIK